MFICLFITVNDNFCSIEIFFSQSYKDVKISIVLLKFRNITQQKKRIHFLTASFECCNLV